MSLNCKLYSCWVNNWHRYYVAKSYSQIADFLKVSDSFVWTKTKQVEFSEIRIRKGADNFLTEDSEGFTVPIIVLEGCEIEKRLLAREKEKTK